MGSSSSLITIGVMTLFHLFSAEQSVHFVFLTTVNKKSPETAELRQTADVLDKFFAAKHIANPLNILVHLQLL